MPSPDMDIEGEGMVIDESPVAQPPKEAASQSRKGSRARSRKVSEARKPSNSRARKEGETPQPNGTAGKKKKSKSTKKTPSKKSSPESDSSGSKSAAAAEEKAGEGYSADQLEQVGITGWTALKLRQKAVSWLKANGDRPMDDGTPPPESRCRALSLTPRLAARCLTAGPPSASR